MMGDSVRMDIENKICSEQGPRSDSFEQAQDRAYQTMTQVAGMSMQQACLHIQALT